jgi:Spy/CpxP family protein refolding chaperone
MKKIILTVGICVASLLSIQAQQTMKKSAPTIDQKVDKMMGILTSICNLTPDQVTKVKPIVTETVQATTANKQQYGSDKDKLKAANQATLKTERAKLNAILTPDQQAKLTTYQKERAEKRKAASTTSQQ